MKTIILSLFIPFLLTSCKTYYYMPTMQNVPLFKEKKGVYISIGGDEHNMGCLQGAYSLTDHIGTQFTYMSRNNHNDYIFEGGIGYFLRYKDNLAFETYGGYGSGMVARNRENINMDLKRIYLQPSLGYTSEIIDIIFTLRFTEVNYNVNYSNNMPQTNTVDPDLYIMDKQNYFFCEPGFTVRLGYKYIKLQYQYIKANKLNSDVLKYINTNNSVSIIFNLPFKNIKKK